MNLIPQVQTYGFDNFTRVCDNGHVIKLKFMIKDGLELNNTKGLRYQGI